MASLGPHSPSPHPPGPRPPARPGTGGWLLLALGAALVALPFVAAALGGEAAVTLATRILIFAIAAGSLNLLIGYGGLVSFGHAAYFGVGAYAVGILFAHLRAPMFDVIPGSDQLLVTVPVAMLAAGLVALVVGALSLRTSGVQFIMITLAFAQMVFYLFVSLKAYGGDDGLSVRRRNALPFIDTRDDTVFYFVCLAVAALFYALLDRLLRSRFGRVLEGIRQSERRMESLGLKPYPYKLAAFVLSGMGCGLAGALMANATRFVSPDMMHWTQSGELIVMIILGGVGTWLGPAAGAAILLGLETVLAAWTEHWQVVLGLILIAVVLAGRGGASRALGLLSGRGR